MISIWERGTCACLRVRPGSPSPCAVPSRAAAAVPGTWSPWWLPVPLGKPPGGEDPGSSGLAEGAGGAPFYLPFPSALPCRSPPTRPSPRPALLPAAADLPGFPGAGEGEGGRGKGRGGWDGGRGEGRGGLKLALQSLRVAGRARWPVLTVRLKRRALRGAGGGAGAGQSRACWPRCPPGARMKQRGRRRGCEGRSSAASQCRLSSVNEPPLSEGLPPHTHTDTHPRTHTHAHTTLAHTRSRAQHCIH